MMRNTDYFWGIICFGIGVGRCGGSECLDGGGSNIGVVVDEYGIMLTVLFPSDSIITIAITASSKLLSDLFTTSLSLMSDLANFYSVFMSILAHVHAGIKSPFSSSYHFSCGDYFLTLN